MSPTTTEIDGLPYEPTAEEVENQWQQQQAAMKDVASAAEIWAPGCRDNNSSSI